MPVIFEKNRGAVVRVDDPTAQARVGFVKVSDPIGYKSQQSIITRLTINQQANVQFLHTLGAAIYIYVFGDRIGNLSLSGLSFAAPCEGDNGRDHGIVQMMDWYRKNRVSKSGNPVRVTIGSSVSIEGFVVSSTFDTVEPESGMVQWGLNMQTLPET